MLDFMQITTKPTKNGGTTVFPTFKMYPEPKDLLIRGKDFYAIWDEEEKMWSTKESVALSLIDRELERYVEDNKRRFEKTPQVLYMWDADSGMVDKFHKFCQKQMRDTYITLDKELVFTNTEIKRETYASKKLPYPLEAGDISSWDKIVGTLYNPEERRKIEWAIGAIVSGDSRWIQKFLVFYGPGGTGKSTIMNIIQQLFEGYYATFEAKALGSNNNQYSLEPFKNNPLVAIQHDGDLSRIEDNATLNSLISHEDLVVNAKYQGLYTMSFQAFLILGTNRPVKITDAKSGLLRRLIDVSPSERKLGIREYRTLTEKVKFELGAIAYHCLQVYKEDPHYYDGYVARSMIAASNDFYNYMIDSFSVFKKNDGTTLKTAWEMYKAYVEDAKVPYPHSRRTFQEELKNYFWNFETRAKDEDGNNISNYYSGFRLDKFEDDLPSQTVPKAEPTKTESWLDFKKQESIFEKEYLDCPAQYASDGGTPMRKWDDTKTKLKDIDTKKLHYVKVPEQHIVIDFDIKDENGEKSFEKNLEAASKWPATYAELSKSGGGIHLHYIYSGDVSNLSRVYDADIEVKIFNGNSSLRRMLTKCVNLDIATISSGLPTKEKGGTKVVNFDGLKSERALRTLIKRHLNKEIMESTASSVQMISKVLDETYDSGLCYDVSDMRNAIYAFAAGSTNQSENCIKLVNNMKFKSEETSTTEAEYDELVFFDIEVFPNLFLVNWKIAGEGKPVVRMINPKPHEIEELIKYKLVGFNNRSYDNHMLYGCLMGYNNEQLYNLSKRLISKDKGVSNNAKFREAYNLSYTDVYDFSSAVNKQSLKKWEVQLGLSHQELGFDWDSPVPEDKWEEVAAYCDNDILSTEAVFYHLKGDWTARQILAELTGMTVNDTTNSLTVKFIFGNERKPELVYTDLATGKQYDIRGEELPFNPDIASFEGYEFKWITDKNGSRKPQNFYRDTDIGFGGYIISNPGIYGNVALIDVASLHPNSLIAMNYFGEYTQAYKDILDVRILIKHGDFESAKKLMDGRLAKYLDDPSMAKDLSNALKTVLNSTYGLTAASFDHVMKHPLNRNNIIALRGALFMRTLQDEVESRGYKIVAIKTDSIKIADADKEIVDFCLDFAKKYSYTFEFEAFYDKMCQVNDADYVARYKDKESCEKIFGYVPGDNNKKAGQWTATGSKFTVPYVFKKLFSHEPIEFKDLCHVFSVQGAALYLDMNESLPDISEYEKEFAKAEGQYKRGQLSDTTFESTCAELHEKIAEGHDYKFVGRVGNFCPIKPGFGGGELVVKRNDKYDSANGSKGFRWLESEMIRDVNEDAIDMSYFNKLVDDMIHGTGTGKQYKPGIADFGDPEWFISDDPYIGKEKTPDFMKIPDDAPEEMPWD